MNIIALAAYWVLSRRCFLSEGHVQIRRQVYIFVQSKVA